MSAVAIALNRFGLGAGPADPDKFDPKDWLLSQFGRYQPLPPTWSDAASTVDLLQTWVKLRQTVRNTPEANRGGVREEYIRGARKEYVRAVGARVNSALQTTTPFVERLVHFWANHFAVSVDKILMVGFAGAMERDAIRPNVLGNFETLLLAVLQHPAMLLFLDQATSVGPDSVVATNRSNGQGRLRGLNENLAREIFELHTMGVRSGYSQQDVTELARALTGWTLPGAAILQGSQTTFRYVPAMHEPGTRKVLSREYADTGQAQATAIIGELARSPETARHIATKLARHFVADEPDQALVNQLAETFLNTNGDLPSLYQALIEAPQTWQEGDGKFKSPSDWAISALRALGQQELAAEQSIRLMNRLGQPVWRPKSPAGYADTTQAWAAPDALMRRVEMAQFLASQVGDTTDARSLAPRILPGTLSRSTQQIIAQAESPTTGLALLLVSPEFLRR